MCVYVRVSYIASCRERELWRGGAGRRLADRNGTGLQGVKPRSKVASSHDIADTSPRRLFLQHHHELQSVGAVQGQGNQRRQCSVPREARGRAYRIQHSTHSLGMGWAVTHDLVKVRQQLGAIVSLLSQGLLRFAAFRGTQRVHAWQRQRETKLDACASIELRQQGRTRHAHVRATTTP